MVKGLDLTLSSLNSSTPNLVAPPPPPPRYRYVYRDAEIQRWSVKEKRTFVKALNESGAILKYSEDFCTSVAERIPGKTVLQIQKFFEKYLIENGVHPSEIKKKKPIRYMRSAIQNGHHERKVVQCRKQSAATTRMHIVKNNNRLEFRASSSATNINADQVAAARIIMEGDPAAKPTMFNLFPAPASNDQDSTLGHP